MFRDWWLDIRYGVRRLLHSPGFSIVAILTLAVGIAINTTIFSIASALILQPMAARQPESIVAVFTSTDSQSLYRSSSYPDYVDIHNAAKDVMSDLAVVGMSPVDLQGEKGQRVTAGTVSGNYFTVLGVGALVGQTFTATDDDARSPHAVAVLNEKIWRERFGSDPRVIGKFIRLNQQSYTVIGVMEHKYCAIRRFIEVDAFVPMMTRGLLTGEPMQNRDARQFFLLGRLLPGTTIKQAQARMTMAAAALHRNDPRDWTTDGGRAGTITVVSESNSRVPPSARPGVLASLLFLQLIVGIVLLIACSNLANLSLARALGREKEIAVRIALGSSRWRLVRELLTESLLLAAGGCVAGLLLTRWIVQSLMAIRIPIEVTVYLNLGLDYRVMLFAPFVTTITAVLFGLAPALHVTHAGVVVSLKQGGGTRGGARFTLRSALIVAEVALSVVLLVPAGLFVRSVQNINKVNLGFDPHNLALVSVSLSPERYNAEQGLAAYRAMVERLRRVPGVIDVDLGVMVPLSGMENAQDYRETGTTQAPHTVSENLVGPNYFSTMGIHMLRGRVFTVAVGVNSPQVAIVNQAFANAYWPKQDPLGKRIVAINKPEENIEIVGVVQTGKYDNVNEGATPYLYRSIYQDYSPTAVLHVRTINAPETMLQVLAAAVQPFDRSMPLFDMKTMDQQLTLSVGPFASLATALVVFGGAGLLMACVGLCGVIAYSTARRRREIAIRMALGAGRTDILRLLVGQGVKLFAIGIAVGVPLAGGAVVLISRLLFGVAPTDAVTYFSVVALLGIVAMAAIYIPAFRATRIPPYDALHAE